MKISIIKAKKYQCPINLIFNKTHNFHINNTKCFGNSMIEYKNRFNFYKP